MRNFAISTLFLVSILVTGACAGRQIRTRSVAAPPIAEAALVHCLTACSIPALMEILGNGTRTWPHLPKAFDFKDGKMWPNDRPGLGVEVDVSQLTKIGEYNTYRAGMLLNRRPDGSYTQW